MKYFKPEEFVCDGQVVFDKMKPALLTKLDEMREIAAIPMQINSSWRSKESNDKVGGKEGSAHMEGYAVDIHCPTSTIRYTLVQAAVEAGFTRIGIGKSFIHVDVDPTKPQDVIWLY